MNIMQNDINQTDEKGLKQGLWKIDSSLGQYWSQNFINGIPLGYYEYQFYTNEFKQSGYYAK